MTRTKRMWPEIQINIKSLFSILPFLGIFSLLTVPYINTETQNDNAKTISNDAILLWNLPKKLNLFYTPETNFTKEIINRINKQLNLAQKAIKSFETKQELHSFYKKYGDLESPIAFVVFNEDNHRRLDYDLTYHERYLEWNTKQLFDEDVSSNSKYLMKSFIALQILIDKAFIDINSNTNSLLNVEFQTDNKKSDFLKNFIPLLLIVCLISKFYTLPECEIKKLPNDVLVNRNRLIVDISLAFGAVFTLKFPFWGVSVFEKTDSVILFVFVLIYIDSVDSFCLLNSSIFANFGITDSICGPLLWIFSYAIPFTFFEDNVFCTAIPNIAMKYGFSFILKEETASGINWTNLYKTDLTSVVIILIFISILFKSLSVYFYSIKPYFEDQQTSPKPICKKTKVLISVACCVTLSIISLLLIKTGTKIYNYQGPALNLTPDTYNRSRVNSKIKIFDGNISIECFYSSEALHSAPIAVNLAMNSVAKTLLGDDFSIFTKNAPLESEFRHFAPQIEDYQIVTIVFVLVPTVCAFLINSYWKLEKTTDDFKNLSGLLNLIMQLFYNAVVFSVLAVILSLCNILFSKPFGVQELGPLLVIFGYCSAFWPVVCSSYNKEMPKILALLMIIGWFQTIIVSVIEYEKQAAGFLKIVFMVTNPFFSVCYTSIKVAKMYSDQHRIDSDKDFCFYDLQPCCYNRTDTLECVNSKSYFYNTELGIASELQFIFWSFIFFCLVTRIRFGKKLSIQFDNELALLDQKC